MNKNRQKNRIFLRWINNSKKTPDNLWPYKKKHSNFTYQPYKITTYTWHTHIHTNEQTKNKRLKMKRWPCETQFVIYIDMLDMKQQLLPPFLFFFLRCTFCVCAIGFISQYTYDFFFNQYLNPPSTTYSTIT